MKTITCCNQKLTCDRFTNTCPKCGADYNMSGHRLAPREQWGEETGESLQDIMGPWPPGQDEFDGDY